MSRLRRPQRHPVPSRPYEPGWSHIGEAVRMQIGNLLGWHSQEHCSVQELCLRHLPEKHVPPGQRSVHAHRRTQVRGLPGSQFVQSQKQHCRRGGLHLRARVHSSSHQHDSGMQPKCLLPEGLVCGGPRLRSVPGAFHWAGAQPQHPQLPVCAELLLELRLNGVCTVPPARGIAEQ